jgi:uncharacterized protein GlcG (DUF336 family)
MDLSPSVCEEGALVGVTIIDSEATLGTIDVSGAPCSQFDEECARAAFTKSQERMK